MATLIMRLNAEQTASATRTIKTGGMPPTKSYRQANIASEIAKTPGNPSVRERR
jgi:hypothetical protein